MEFFLIFSIVLLVLLYWYDERRHENLRCELKKSNENLEKFSIKNFRKIEVVYVRYVRDEDVLSVPIDSESSCVHYLVYCKDVSRWLKDFNLERVGALEIFGSSKSDKAHEMAVLVKVFRPVFEEEYSMNVETITTVYWIEEIDFRWTVFREFVDALLKDLAYGDPEQGSYPKARVNDLLLLLGSDSEVDILRILNYSACSFRKELWEKMQKIRKVIDLRSASIGSVLMDSQKHFDFLMSRVAGLDKDRRVVDLLDTEEGFKKVCDYFKVLNVTHE